MSYYNACFAPSGPELYTNKEDEVSGLYYDNSMPMYMSAIQDQYGITSWTIPDSFNSCAFESFTQPAVHLQSDGFPNTWPSLLPSSNQGVSGPNVFDFSPLSSASLNSRFIPSNTSAQQLYVGSYPQSPIAPNGLCSESLILGGNGALPMGQSGFSPLDPSLTYHQFGSSQIDTPSISVPMNALALPMTGVSNHAPTCGTALLPAVTKQDNTSDAPPPTPLPSKVKTSRAKGKTPPSASHLTSAQPAEPEVAQVILDKSEEKKSTTCETCNITFSCSTILNRHELIHKKNTFFCAHPPCWTSHTKKKIGFNRASSIRRHLLGQFIKEGERSKCVLAARARGWKLEYPSENVLKTGRPPRE